MTKLKEMKKKPSKLNSAKQTLLSKYLKPRPKSPELEVEIADNIVSKKEDLSEPIKATSGQGSLEQKSIENVSSLNLAYHLKIIEILY